MPRESGVAILSIRPDGDLGRAQDSAIPVPAVALDQINKANQDLRSYQLQRNIMKYDQQLKQRDNLIKGIHEGEISTGAILPEDREAYNESVRKVRDAFLAVTSEESDAKGQNKKLSEYKQALQDHNDFTTMLQARYVGVGKKREELSKAVLPSEQKRRQADIDKSIKADKWSPVIPYQEDLDFDPDYLAKIGLNGAWVDDNGNPVSDVATTEKVTTNSKGTTVQKTTAPVKTVVKNGKLIPVSGTEETKNGDLPIFTTTPGKKYEYRNTLANMIEAYNTDEKARVMMDKQLEMYQFTEDPQAQALFNVDNQGLAIMDQQNGIPTIKHYPDGLNRVGPPNPDNPNDPVGKEEDTGVYPSEINHRYVGNKLVIEESAPSLAAKLLAGKMRNYKIEGQKVFNEDAFKLNMENAKNKADIMLKGAQAQGQRAKSAWYHAKIAAMKPDDQDKAINDGYKYNLTTQTALAVPKGSGYELAKIPGNQTTPIFTWASGKDGGAAKPVIIKPIGSKPIYGNDPKNPATFGKVVGYEGGHYDQQYIFGGKPLSEKDLWEMYNKFKKDTPSWNKGFDDYLKAAINNDFFDVKIIGENGSTDRSVHTQALKAISNANSKKGQDQPFYESFDENEN